MKPELQVHAPYDYLVRDLAFVIKQRLNPEIYFSANDLDRLKVKIAKDTARALKLNGTTITFHAPFRDLSPGGHDSKVRKVTLERLHETLELARYFHPKVVVCHSGFYLWARSAPLDEWVKRSLPIWRSLVARAKKLGTVIALENVYEDSPEPIVQILKGIPSPFLGFCYDVGHSHIFSRVPAVSWLKALGSRTVEVHLHDNHGKEDEHLPLGQGDIDFGQLFSLLSRYANQPILAIEPTQKRHIARYVEVLKKIGVR